jgi:hypothetical protein
MSNEMFLGATEFRISRKKEEAAHGALIDLSVDVVEGWEDERAGKIQEKVKETGRTVGQLTIDELIECWGWHLIRDISNQTDEIIDIDLMEDFSSDEETLFETLAPLLRDTTSLSCNKA